MFYGLSAVSISGLKCSRDLTQRGGAVENRCGTEFIVWNGRIFKRAFIANKYTLLLLLRTWLLVQHDVGIVVSSACLGHADISVMASLCSDAIG